MEHAAQHIKFLQDRSRSDDHALQGTIGGHDRHPGLVHQTLVNPPQQRSPAGENDPALHDVGCELGRGFVQGVLDRIDDGLDRLLHGLSNVLA